MSWSINFIGKPGNIVTALQKESERLTGQSKVEYDAALPYLIGIVQGNSNVDEQYLPVLHLQASGHAYIKDGETQYSTCQVQLSPLGGGTLV